MPADWRNPVVVVDDDDERFTATVFVLVVVEITGPWAARFIRERDFLRLGFGIGIISNNTSHFPAVIF